jgi:hypothetical protein
MRRPNTPVAAPRSEHTVSCNLSLGRHGSQEIGPHHPRRSVPEFVGQRAPVQDHVINE